MFNCRAFQFCLAFVFIFITGFFSHCLSKPSDLGFQSILVWGQRDNLGKYNIHFSRHPGDQWSRPEILSSTDRPSILPAVSSDGQANIWIAWTELHGSYGRILFCFFANDGWSAPAILETSTISDMAPSLAISADGVPWLVFSGSDGSQDDIYSVHWTGEKWSQPLKVNNDDDRPDILPDITLASNGQPVVRWQGYNGNQYVTYSSHWNGSNWSAEQEIPSRNVLSGEKKYTTSADEEREILMQDLPEFITDTSQAVFYHYRGGKSETIKLNRRR